MLSPEQIAQLRGEAGLSPTPPAQGTDDIIAARKKALGISETPEPSFMDTVKSRASAVVEDPSGAATGFVKRAGRTAIDTAEQVQLRNENGTVINPATSDLQQSTLNLLTDSARFDAFSRLRVSTPSYVFDGQLTYDLQPLLFEQITAESGATIAHDTTNRMALHHDFLYEKKENLKHPQLLSRDFLSLLISEVFLFVLPYYFLRACAFIMASACV